MATKDPRKATRNQRIKELSAEIELLVPAVLECTGIPTLQSLNARYGGKHADYIDIANEVISSPEEFYSLYLYGFVRYLRELPKDELTTSAHYRNFMHVHTHEVVREWLKLFLERTYLRNYEALSKVRPSVTDLEWWIGQNNASYGLFVTPRFAKGAWENDKSEVRHFRANYWTIGHVLHTGLVIPDVEQRIRFADVEGYLTFFQHTLVRNSRSRHEMAIAQRYCDYVRKHTDPNNVPLLIPELRYDGKESQHRYRLDFTVLDPYTHSKVGFELSPWSTHGEITGTKAKTQKEINEIARLNFDKEVQKQKDYFVEKGIVVLIYTDEDLKDYDKIFEQISTYLAPKQRVKQLALQAHADFKAYGDRLSSVRI